MPSKVLPSKGSIDSRSMKNQFKPTKARRRLVPTTKKLVDPDDYDEMNIIGRKSINNGISTLFPSKKNSFIKDSTYN